jgi:hypothetical protein
MCAGLTVLHIIRILPNKWFVFRLKGDSGTGTPGSGHSSRSSPKRAQLVSYHDADAGLSDEEHEPGTGTAIFQSNFVRRKYPTNM